MGNGIFGVVERWNADFQARIQDIGEIYKVFGPQIPEEMMISAKDYVNALVCMYTNEKKFSGRRLSSNSYISEKVLHIPKIKKKILIKDGVNWHSHSNDYGMLMDFLFSLDEQVHVIENSKPIPFKRFKEEGLTRFLFGNESEEIGYKLSQFFSQYFKNSKIKKLRLSFIENDKDLAYAREKNAVPKGAYSWEKRLPLNRMGVFSAKLNLSFHYDFSLSGSGRDSGKFHLINKTPHQGKNGGNVFQGDLSPWLNDYVKRKNPNTNLKKLEEIFEQHDRKPILLVENETNSLDRQMYAGIINSKLNFVFGKASNGLFLELPLDYFSKFVVDGYQSPSRGGVKDSEQKLYFGFERGSVPTLDSIHKIKVVGSLLEKYNHIEVFIGKESIEKRIISSLGHNGVKNLQSYFDFLEKVNLVPSQKLTASLENLRLARRSLNYMNNMYGHGFATDLIDLLEKNEESLENVEVLPGMQANLRKYSRYSYGHK